MAKGMAQVAISFAQFRKGIGSIQDAMRLDPVTRGRRMDLRRIFTTSVAAFHLGEAISMRDANWFKVALCAGRCAL